MGKQLQAIRGMNDILPDQTPAWQYLEQQVRSVLGTYGYQEIRVPIAESSALFSRGIGTGTDIVEKEMYTFEDRNGEKLSLRPEATASIVRAGIQNGLLYNQIQRLWTSGPMFRYERPQKGRYRQFHQISVEAYGMVGPDIDAELILMTARLWQQLGLSEHVTLELNTLGTQESRLRYREALVAYLSQYEADLDEDSRRRLTINPLRILDSKDAGTQKIVADAPELFDYLDEESRNHFEDLKKVLDEAGVSYRVNTKLVRGLDYYGRTVFEWITESLGSQGTVCAGGRYDALVEMLGGKPTAGVGFAMGMERLILMLETLQLLPETVNNQVDVTVVAVGDGIGNKALPVVERLRDALPQFKILMNCGGGGFKAQMKRADRSGAKYALIIGEDELQAGTATIKSLRADEAQQQLPLSEVSGFLKSILQ
ncbi:histidine--tRNA ligase [uncultured Endozoicomonas sp.]|uniref:histidine--tRNA ligase n=1 Tax=uncultured Endozoicomonas sp. TaxID=432652 RepID=UPI00262DFA89|nr:histidine--tRNA ligase [uncultured Endozoicomonas sp.]